MRYFQIKEAIEDNQLLDPQFDSTLKDAASKAHTTDEKKNFIDSVKEVGKHIDDKVKEIIAKYKNNPEAQDDQPVDEDAMSMPMPSANADPGSLFKFAREFIRNKIAEAKPMIEKYVPENAQKAELANIKKTAWADFKQVYTQGFGRGGDAKEKSFAEYKKRLTDKVNQLVKKAEGLDPESELDKRNMSAVQLSIEARLKSIIDSIEQKGISPETIDTFLDLAIQGKIINMVALVASKKGKIDDHISTALPADVKKLFDEEIKNAFFSFIPGGTTAGNYGPAEVGLAILGNPAKKAEVGDLDVNGVMFELKGSGYKKINAKGEGTGGYGARLNSKGIANGTAGWNALNKGIKAVNPNIKGSNSEPYNAEQMMSAPIPKGKEGYKSGPEIAKEAQGWLTYGNPNFKTKEWKISSRYNFNKEGMDRLNAEVLEPIGDKRKTLNDLLLPTLKAIVTGWKKVDNFENLVADMVKEDGTINYPKFLRNYSAIAYGSYNKEDKVQNILFINSTNRNYFLISDQEQLLTAIDEKDIFVSGGVTWNDDQQKATPQYGRA